MYDLSFMQPRGLDGDDNDRRVSSDRTQDAFEQVDRPRAKKGGTPTFAGQVYDGGNLPSTAPAWFLTYPVELSGSETEGGIYTASADAQKSVPVIVLGNPASPGDILIAEMIGGKWVAERSGQCRPSICLNACSPGLPVYGATINLITGGSVVASCTTDATGCCVFTQTGSYLVQVVINGNIVYSATRTLGCAPILIVLGSNSGLVCCGGYAIPEVLTLTDAVGSITFVYDPSYFYPIWTGGHSVTLYSSTVATPNNTCVVNPPYYGPVRVCYQMICHAGQNPTFALQRSWSWVYQPGTLTPIWYQDSSGFAPGQLCITAPPAICGSPLTDTSSCSTNPSSTTPFALSCTPAPSPSNATAEPISGSVAISA